ncbi:hypothetical protein, partial [Bradyrhizobium sp. 157]|uniref:hypothetical protein n=1 Tax=Bradyrhizobium sp. 157 TaxID=2782631 RepID=UPI001FF9EF5E
IFVMDGPLVWFDSASPVWHIDAVRGPSTPSLRANGSRECAPDDRLREAIHASTRGDRWIASSLQRKIAPQFCRELLAMTRRELRFTEKFAV